MKKQIVIAVAAAITAVAQTAWAAESAPAVGAAPAAATSKLQPLPMLPTPPDCLQQTGSAVKTPAGACVPTAIGVSYDRKDIDSTGATRMGDALQKMDPRITIQSR